jgi:hypothetical protein
MITASSTTTLPQQESLSTVKGVIDELNDEEKVYYCTTIFEKATDGNKTCIEIYQRAKQGMITRDDANANKTSSIRNLTYNSTDTTYNDDICSIVNQIRR